MAGGAHARDRARRAGGTARTAAFRAIVISMAKPLAPGIYEHPYTRELAARADISGEVGLETVKVEQLAPMLARHLGREIERVLEHLPLELAADASARLLAVLAEVAQQAKRIPDDLAGQALAPPPRRLMSVGAVAAGRRRPATPLARSTLFTRSHGEPRLQAELAHEIESADRVDVLIAFITIGGVRALREAFDRLVLQTGSGPRLRVLTTTFTGTTEVEAVEALAALPGAEVKVSFDTRRTRLHAKAWLFHRASGLSTAYVGSANLTATALGAGHEWMLKVSATDLPHVVDHFGGTFETLWQDPEFERYHLGDDLQRARLRAALRGERGASVGDGPLTLFTLRPFPFQLAILDRIEAERALGRLRNLIVAATGTGKTVIAAFDYARRARTHGVNPRLLFLAHRIEIVSQARDTFRHVLGDAAFGELVSGGHEADRGDHVFATIQSASDLAARFPAEHWDHVIIDECHHLPASSYQSVITRLRPGILVGLTATPERGDGRSLLPDFDGRIAAELRLWHAMEQQLLAPFDYYGIADGTDLRRVKWSRKGYDAGELGGVYTGNEARARLVLRQLERRVADVRKVRGLGFCVSVHHAEYMAARATELGVPAIAVHGGSPAELRDDIHRRLREREVNLVFTCDLYNEGVDLPFVDALLLLRPTMSATLFLQQLGRGLRLHEGKDACLVLDFIGQHREEYRFDAMLGALTGQPRAKLKVSVEQDFPLLPSGCAVSLDPVAREQILASLKRTIGSGAKRLGEELRELSTQRATPLGLAEFLDETGRELEDVYTDGFGWRQVQAIAGVAAATADDLERSRVLGRLLHVDDPAQLAAVTTLAAGTAPAEVRRTLMLDAQVTARGVLRAAEITAAYFRGQTELTQLANLLADASVPRIPIYPESDWPLALHRRYERREIVAAVGDRGVGDKISIPQGGILKLDDSKRELLFVTLDKSGGDFSATTRYRDYAISPDQFHWETQSAASVATSGRRYVESATNGWRFFLFVRVAPTDPFHFAGPVTYVKHEGDRPIAITWALVHSLPPDLFDHFAVLAQS